MRGGGATREGAMWCCGKMARIVRIIVFFLFPFSRSRDRSCLWEKQGVNSLGFLTLVMVILALGGGLPFPA